MAPSTRRTVSLGGGEVVPYPEPVSAAATKVAKANRRTGTKPEDSLRRTLHRLGLRYRKDSLLRVGQVRTHPDIVFGVVRLAVFVDGCFWHVCPDHSSSPKSNIDYWGPKLAANVRRDALVTTELTRAGWNVLRIWEHEATLDAAGLVINELARLGHPGADRAGQRLQADPPG